MSPDDIELVRILEERLRTASPPDWVLRMQEHFQKTGTFPPEDLRRLLGKPTDRVESGGRPCVATFLQG